MKPLHLPPEAKRERTLLACWLYGFASLFFTFVRFLQFLFFFSSLTWLEVEGVFELRLAAGAAVRRLALERVDISRVHESVESDGHHEVRVVPEGFGFGGLYSEVSMWHTLWRFLARRIAMSRLTKCS